MTAIVLPDIDRTTLEKLKKQLPDLSEIELPNLPSKKEVSRTADQAIDRILGRSRTPIWAWVAVAIGLAAIIGIAAVWFAWFRRPTWESASEPWTDEPTADSNEPGGTTVTADAWPTTDASDSFDTPIEAAPVGTSVSSTRSAVGSRPGQRTSTAADDATASSSLPYPIEEA